MYFIYKFRNCILNKTYTRTSKLDMQINNTNRTEKNTGESILIEDVIV